MAGQLINILAYADDIVLIAPSWRALQKLISVLNAGANDICMSCNIKKTVAMVFSPRNSKKIVTTDFPMFKLGNSYINFVPEFKYLGHIINDSLTDDEDIQREMHLMFVRTNILLRKFSKCSKAVKLVLFRSYCLCFYDVALWKWFSAGSLNKFRSCYNRCAKQFFGYKRYDSLSLMLVQTGVPSFDTLMNNYQVTFLACCNKCNNKLLQAFCALHFAL